MAASYPASVKSFTALNPGDTIQDTDPEAAYDEITAMEQALLTTGLAHTLFPDATANNRDLGVGAANRWGSLYLNTAAFIGDSTNVNMTSGITINQGAADNEAVALKSSDVAHGVTTIAETDTYGRLQKGDAAAGGLAIGGFSETGTALVLDCIETSNDTTKSTAATGALKVNGYKKSGTTVGGMDANSNIAVFANNGTTRFILDADGDSHQDVGTAWTNFDDRDDATTLTALSAAVSRPGDPVREAFGALIEAHRADLERAGLVTFQADGHHFVNWSRTHMLVIGAVRQLAQQMQAVTAHLGLPEGYGVRWLPEQP